VLQKVAHAGLNGKLTNSEGVSTFTASQRIYHTWKLWKKQGYFAWHYNRI